MIGVSVDEVDEEGNKKSTIKLTADHIKLEGLITANGNFKILEDGSIEATNGKFKGEIIANKGSIGDLSISSDSLYYGNIENWDLPEKKTLINAGQIRLQNYMIDEKRGKWILHQLFMGESADPDDDDNATFLYINKDQQQGSDIASLYRPAIRIKSTLGNGHYVSMLSTGSIVVNKGGVIEAGAIFDMSPELPLVQQYQFSVGNGSVQVFKNTSGQKRTLYIRIKDEFLNWMFGQNTTDYAVVFTLVGHKDNNADIALSFFDNVLQGASSLTLKANSVIKLLVIRNGDYNSFYCLCNNNL